MMSLFYQTKNWRLFQTAEAAVAINPDEGVFEAVFAANRSANSLSSYRFEGFCGRTGMIPRSGTLGRKEAWGR